jgi:signal transduction histidine kinase
MNAILRFFFQLRLRVKFSLTMLGLVLALVAIVLYLFYTRQKEWILAEVQERAVDLTTVLAFAGARASLEDNYLVLQELIDSIGNREEVAQVMILSSEGKVLAHNYTGQRGKLYQEQPRRNANGESSPVVATYQSGKESFIDVIAPIIVAGEQKAFARVIISLEKARQTIRATAQRILLIGLVSVAVALFLAAFLSGLVIKPLKQLYDNARQISLGAREIQIEVTALDEIGTLQQALKTMLEEVRLRSRLAALGETMANLAHEIRTPLTVISKYLEAGESAPRAERRQMVLGEVNRLNDLVEQLLLFSKNRKFMFSRTNLIDLIEQALFLHEALIQKRRLRVQRDFEKLPPIAADKNLLQSVFMNIISNAIEAMNDEGSLVIQARLVQAQPDRAAAFPVARPPASWLQRMGKGLRERLLVAREKKSAAETSQLAAAPAHGWPQTLPLPLLHSDKDAIVITIADNGHGIPEELLGKLFLPFFTTKENGTGLGLALSHKVIQEHGGTIHVQSKVGKGTILTITFPL